MRAEDKDVYEIIERRLKLTEEQIDGLFEKNKYLKQILEIDIVDLIIFFEEYGLTEEEMAKIALENPYFLTESFERIRYIEEYLKMVDITDIRWMAIRHPISMSQNPMDIKDFIEENRKNGKTDEEIKALLMNDFEKFFVV